MASRSNLSGRKGGYGRGTLSKVYRNASKRFKTARKAGKPPGAAMAGKTGMNFGKRKQRLGITKEQAEAGITNVDEGRAAAGLPKRTLAERMGAKGGFMRAARGMAGKGGYAGDVKSAPGLDQLTGGGKPIVAKQPPPTPPVAMNPLPPAHPPVQRGMGAKGSARLASMGVNPSAPPTMAQPTVMPGPPVHRAASFGAVGTRPARPSIPAAVEPTAAETIGAPAAGMAPEGGMMSSGGNKNIEMMGTPSGGGSVRSRGMHRSAGSRRRAPQDRG